VFLVWLLVRILDIMVAEMEVATMAVKVVDILNMLSDSYLVTEEALS